MSRGDRFGTLQDDLVLHVLSFLPSREVVRSAVLSRRWRHLWRSTPVVRVAGSDDRFRLFVNSLLLHRDATPPLRSFEIEADLSTAGEKVDSDDDDYGDGRTYVVDPHIDQWIRHAVSTCRTRWLSARFPEEDTRWSPRHPRPFASPHLTMMNLEGVKFKAGLLDFSCCPALLHLSLASCHLYAGALVSPSLVRLSIIDCDIRIADGRTRMGISAPSLRHLQLCDDVAQDFPRAPCLESMPCLTNASIRLTGYLAENPVQNYDGGNDGGDHSRAGRSLLLHGLSEATSLELMASPSSDGRGTLLKDLNWCPTFTKLKTLTLNEWCVYSEVTALVCLLRHTPRLESLVLQLPFKKSLTLDVKTEGTHTTSEHSFLTLEHLKTVEIKNCRPSYYYNRMVYFSKRVDQILKLFSDWGIPSSKICINYRKPQGKKIESPSASFFQDQGLVEENTRMFVAAAHRMFRC